MELSMVMENSRGKMEDFIKDFSRETKIMELDYSNMRIMINII